VKRFNPDPARIYLTGHSMGGHGTWFLGATYPGKWAAIAPCAGYPTLLAYGSADGKIPQPKENSLEQTILRSGNGSNVIELARNYGAGGVYVFHGDADSTVPVLFARQMREVLGAFHNDFSYYEYPGGSHWWSNESVDWDPLFRLFQMAYHKARQFCCRYRFHNCKPRDFIPVAVGFNITAERIAEIQPDQAAPRQEECHDYRQY
jgi:predicted peptidase